MNIENILLECRDLQQRQLLFLGYLNKELEKFNSRVVVVGGFALEFYTTGGYRTGDIDVVFPRNDILDKILKKWGFVKTGRHWLNKKLDILFEAPGSVLDPAESGNIVEVKFKALPVYFIGVEDLIVDRLNSFVHWKSIDDERWIKELLLIHKKRIDMDYLKEQAKVNKTFDALLKILKELGGRL